MNSMNDSGEFQEVESNYSGRLSNVSSQTAMIPSSRALLSRDKRLPLDTWNTSGLQENVFGNQYSTFDPLQELKSSRSVYGKIFPNFEMLDAKIADLLQSGGFTQTVTSTLTSQNGS